MRILTSPSPQTKPVSDILVGQGFSWENRNFVKIISDAFIIEAQRKNVIAIDIENNRLYSFGHSSQVIPKVIRMETM